MSFYRRRLPHWAPEGKSLFVTWSLHGSLPRNRFPPPGAPNAGKAFVWMDRHLDAATSGPKWLSNPEIATVVVSAIHYAAKTLRLYELDAYVVMPNHVHLLIKPHVPAPRLMQSIKGFSAREANKLLSRSAEPFWQHESYDHWIRNDAEGEKVRRYILNNPVSAGLAADAHDYRWSSAATPML